MTKQSVRSSLLVLILTASIPTLRAQQSASVTSQPASEKLPSFEVVSIRLDKSGEDQDKLDSTTDGLIARNLSTQYLIAAAFHLNNPDVLAGLRQIPGGPEWVESDRYDIDAKMDSETIGEMQKLNSDQQWEQQRLMLQSLLVDRFQLKLHLETRLGQAYNLVIAKDGSKITRAADSLQPRYGSSKTYIKYQAGSISDLAARLGFLLGHPVIDKTELAGKYNIDLKWSPDDPSQTGDSSPSGPSIFTAIQDQLGLKLEPTKAPIQAVVIDHIERPSAN